MSNKIDNLHLSSDNVKFIKDEVTSLAGKIDHLVLSGSGTNTSTDKEKASEKKALLEARQLLVRHAKSTSEITDVCKDFKCIETENSIICSYCYAGTGNSGKFSYDFSLGDDFKSNPAPREFSNLKKVLVSHLSSKLHTERVNDRELESKEKEVFKSRNFNVGSKLGRQAYKILKTSGSYSGYENDVAVLSAQGVDVGTLNHSRMFAAKFCDSVYSAITEKTQEIVNEPLPATGKPTPVAVIADKITPNRRTMQIVGFHGFVANKFQSLVAGVPALEGEDGIGVTRTMKRGLGNLKIPQNETSSRIVGGAFDGEYFHLNVPEHFLNSELVSEDARRWYSFQWDPAHIIELAEADSRKSSPSIQTNFDTISSVSKSFSHGKSFRQLLDDAALRDAFPDEDEDYEDQDVGPIQQKKYDHPVIFQTPDLLLTATKLFVNFFTITSFIIVI